MDPSPELIDQLYREEVLAARRMTVAERLRAGGELFDSVCQRMRYGIRWQFPNIDDDGVERILRERLDIARRLEQNQ